MKVAIHQTIEVTDEQAIQIADLTDKKQSKRRAKRDEARNFIWSFGEGWEDSLSEYWSEMFETVAPGDIDYDLL